MSNETKWTIPYIIFRLIFGAIKWVLIFVVSVIAMVFTLEA